MTASASTATIDTQARRWLRLEGSPSRRRSRRLRAARWRFLCSCPALLVPDLAIAGYLGGPRIGAFVYNFVHGAAFGLAVAGAGLVLNVPLLALAGVSSLRIPAWIAPPATGSSSLPASATPTSAGSGSRREGPLRPPTTGPRAGRHDRRRVSPARARTSADAIVGAGRALLERGGLEAVTMQAVADAVGVRAPSLYKRFAGRPALIRAIADDVAAELGAVLPRRSRSTIRPRRSGSWPTAIGPLPIGRRAPISSCSRTCCRRPTRAPRPTRRRPPGSCC